MSLVERARERVEEVRTKGVLATLQERGGSSGGNPQLPTVKEIREKGALAVLQERVHGGGGGSHELPTIKEVRERGILGILEERFPRVREVRERGILAARPMVRAKEEVEKKEIVVEEGPAITGRAAVRETRLSVEV